MQPRGRLHEESDYKALEPEVFVRLRATYDAWNAELLPPLEPA